MQKEDQNKKEDKDIDISLKSNKNTAVYCKYCNTKKTTRTWYCYICAFPYNNDDCDD